MKVIYIYICSATVYAHISYHLCVHPVPFMRYMHYFLCVYNF